MRAKEYHRILTEKAHDLQTSLNRGFTPYYGNSEEMHRDSGRDEALEEILDWLANTFDLTLMEEGSCPRTKKSFLIFPEWKMEDNELVCRSGLPLKILKEYGGVKAKELRIVEIVSGRDQLDYGIRKGTPCFAFQADGNLVLHPQHGNPIAFIYPLGEVMLKAHTSWTYTR